MLQSGRGLRDNQQTFKVLHFCYRWTDNRMDGWTDKQMNGRMGGRMDKRMDGQTDE